jgi:dihydropteroate synthase
MLRVHDAAAIRPVARMADAIKAGLRWCPPG